MGEGERRVYASERRLPVVYGRHTGVKSVDACVECVRAGRTRVRAYTRDPLARGPTRECRYQTRMAAIIVPLARKRQKDQREVRGRDRGGPRHTQRCRV